MKQQYDLYKLIKTHKGEDAKDIGKVIGTATSMSCDEPVLFVDIIEMQNFMIEKIS